MSFGFGASAGSTGLGNNGFEVSLDYITGVPDANVLPSNDLRLFFIGLQKRDNITREKSITGLAELVARQPKSIDNDIVIMSWCQMYAKLALDTSKRVRSSSHKVQSQFVQSLGRRYAKYLKDTVGIWLSGMFDADRAVCRAAEGSLLDAFGGDSHKVSSLWKLFVDQITNFCRTAIVQETKETLSDDRFVDANESKAKYQRVVLAATSMLAQILHRANSGSLVLKQDSTVNVLEVLESPRFGTLFTDKDPQLKKAVYQLAGVTFAGKTTSELVSDELFKKVFKAALSGLKLGSREHRIVYSSCMTSILNALVVMTKHNSSLWATTKKAQTHLVDFLKMGSLQSDPVYYNMLSALFDQLPEDFLSRSKLSDVQPYLNVLEADIAADSTARFQGSCWKCYLKFAKSAVDKLREDDADTVLSSVQKTVVSALDTKRPVSATHFSTLGSFANDNVDVLLDIDSAILDALPGKKIEFSDFDLSVSNQDQFVANFVSVLQANKSDLLEVLIANAADSLQDEADEKPTLALTIIDVYIQKGINEYSSTVSDAVSGLNSLMTSDFYEQPLKVIVDYSNSVLCTDDITPIVDSAFAKLKDFHQEEAVAKLIPQIKGFSIKESPGVREYLLQKSHSTLSESSDDSLFKVLSPTILKNMFASADTPEKFDSFVSGCVKHYNGEQITKFAGQTPEFIKRLTALQGDSAALLTKLEAELMSNSDLKNAYIKAVIDVVESGKSTRDLVSRVKSLSPEVVKDFLPEDILGAVLPSSPDSRLAISNPLGTVIYNFVSEPSKAADIQIPEKTLLTAAFYSQLGTLPSRLALQLIILGLFGSDCLFLDNTLSEEARSAIDALNESKLLDSLSPSLADLISLEGSEVAGQISSLLSDSNETLRYYGFCVYQKLLTQTRQNVHLADVAQLPRDHAKLVALLNSDPDLVASEKLSRMRNEAAANLIGLRSSADIIKKGLPNLALLNRLIDLDADQKVDLFPPQRLNMVLTSLSNWMDCDAAYDPEFVAVRVCLLEFVQNYIGSIYGVCDSNYPDSFAEKVFDLGWRVCTDCLSMANSGDPGSLELGYFSLKVYISLGKYADRLDSDDSQEDAESDLVELLFAHLKANSTSRASFMVEQLFSRVFFQFAEISVLLPRYSELYDYVDQRLAVEMLDQMIPAVQDDVVVESTIDKDKQAELPGALVGRISEFPVDDEAETLQPFLLSWFLVLRHFEGVTHTIKESYLSQIGEKEIFEFLTFLVTSIEDKNVKVTGKEEVVEYSPKEGESMEPDEEVSRLLVHLLFLTMKYVGSTTIQTWYASIRDKQLKKWATEFITKHVSSILIEDVLDKMSAKSEIEDDKFKIKVNRAINEIKCQCEIDDQIMEISIDLPADYPLSQITVKGVSRVGVDEKKWKSWLMSCQYVINFQNVSILDAVKHFKQNVESNFENYDDCAICYSIINAVDRSTPNKVCPTCHHNFHSACLYRWFKSSGASTCPLCRSKFSFKKHN